MNAKRDPQAKAIESGKPRGGGFSYPVVIGIAVALGLLTIVSTSFSGGQYSLSLADVAAQPGAYEGKDLRVTGKIKPSSTKVSERDGRMELHFVLTDGEGNDSKVVYPHNPPDPYKEGRQAIVEGRMESGGVIRAHKLTVKCPSKYQTEGTTQDPAKLEEYRQKYGQSADGDY